jgi:hypothetical protein
MADIIGRCGFRCSRCLIYKDNLKGEPDRRRFRDGLLKYYGDKLTLEECYCDGCLAGDSENPIRINKECKIRPCVLEKGLENCAYCERYPCEILEPKMIDYRKVMERYGAPLPQEDYELFVEPYENRQTLDELRDKRGGVKKQ